MYDCIYIYISLSVFPAQLPMNQPGFQNIRGSTLSEIGTGQNDLNQNHECIGAQTTGSHPKVWFRLSGTPINGLVYHLVI